MIERRMDPDIGIVRRCSKCKEWWPDDLEFYRPLTQKVRMCRACIAECKAKRPTPLRPVTHGRVVDLEKKRQRDRERKAALRRDPILGAKLRERERLAQQRYYERNKAAERARHREWYARQLDRPIREGWGRPRLDDAA